MLELIGNPDQISLHFTSIRNWNKAVRYIRVLISGGINASNWDVIKAIRLRVGSCRVYHSLNTFWGNIPLETNREDKKNKNGKNGQEQQRWMMVRENVEVNDGNYSALCLLFFFSPSYSSKVYYQAPVGAFLVNKENVNRNLYGKHHSRREEINELNLREREKTTATLYLMRKWWKSSATETNAFFPFSRFMSSLYEITARYTVSMTKRQNDLSPNRFRSVWASTREYDQET